jgi:microcystin-dependent protein
MKNLIIAFLLLFSSTLCIGQDLYAPKVGEIVFHSGNAASPDTVPAGWLFANGQAVSRATYKALFQAIGTTYGTGDGSTTFNVPDCNGRVLAGRDNQGGLDRARLTAPFNGDTLAAAGGAQSETPTTTGIVLAHVVTAAAHSHSPTSATSGNDLTFGTTGSSHSHTLTNAVVSTSSGTLQNQSNVNVEPILASTRTLTGGSHTHNLTGAVGNTGGVSGGSTLTATVTNNHSAGSTPYVKLQPTLVMNCLIKY